MAEGPDVPVPRHLLPWLADVEEEESSESPEALVPQAPLAEPSESKLSISSDLVDALTRGGMGADFANSKLRPHLEAILARVQAPGDQMATDYVELQKVGRHYFALGSPKLHASKQAISHILCIPASHLESHLSLITSTLLHLESVEQTRLEEALVDAGAELISYLEFVRFDETPMKVGQRSSLDHLSRSDGSHHKAPSTLGHGRSSSSSTMLRVSGDLARIATPSKVLAIDQKVLMLVKIKVPTADAVEAPVLVALQTTCLRPLKLLESPTPSVRVAA